MPAPQQDRLVIAWVIDELSNLRRNECPPGWRMVALVGGCFDGLRFFVPPDAEHRTHVIYLPTTASDRPGGPCYAVYAADWERRRARFDHIEAAPPGASAFGVDTPV